MIKVYTPPHTNTLPITVKQTRKISEIETLNDVNLYENFFTSLLKVMCDFNNLTESLDLTKHLKMLYSFALKN